MKKVIWKNKDLDEPYEGIGAEEDIVITDDGYVYCQDTANDPIDEGRWEDYVDADHVPEML